MVQLISGILHAGVDFYSIFNQETALTAACSFDSSPHSPSRFLLALFFEKKPELKHLYLG
jgi:hypothetical protein